MSSETSTEPFPYNTPPWRRSYRAVSPDGVVVATIDEAFEHSMSNPTVGTLRTSNGLELSKCNPSFLWSDDSRFLAVPRWCWRFGFFRCQRLALVDVLARTVYESPFTHWLMLPKTFEHGRLEVLVSDRRGISWPWQDQPLVLNVPPVPPSFAKLKGGPS